MELGLADKVALVSGSSRGIGLATARAFLREGSRTVITGRDEASLREARDALASEFGDERVLACGGDLGDAATIDAVLGTVADRWDPPDCLVANVGTGRGTPGWDVDQSDWDRLLEANLASTYRLTRQVLRAMTPRRSGSIVLVASIAGVESTPAPLAYSAAKAAIVNYAKNLARELGPLNIRVNCVAPGNILFPGGSWEGHLARRRDEVLQMIEAEVPLRRFGQPEEIADLIAFLSSERASFITGSCVIADGGQTRSV